MRLKKAARFLVMAGMASLLAGSAWGDEADGDPEQLLTAPPGLFWSLRKTSGNCKPTPSQARKTAAGPLSPAPKTVRARARRPAHGRRRAPTPKTAGARTSRALPTIPTQTPGSRTPLRTAGAKPGKTTGRVALTAPKRPKHRTAPKRPRALQNPPRTRGPSSPRNPRRSARPRRRASFLPAMPQSPWIASLRLHRPRLIPGAERCTRTWSLRRAATSATARAASSAGRTCGGP